MDLNIIYKEVAKDLDINEEDIKAVYQSIFKYIKGILITLPLAKINDKQQLSSLKTNFNINGLCKLFINYYRLKQINKNNGKYK